MALLLAAAAQHAKDESRCLGHLDALEAAVTPDVVVRLRALSIVDNCRREWREVVGRWEAYEDDHVLFSNHSGGGGRLPVSPHISLFIDAGLRGVTHALGLGYSSGSGSGSRSSIISRRRRRRVVRGPGEDCDGGQVVVGGTALPPLAAATSMHRLARALNGAFVGLLHDQLLCLPFSSSMDGSSSRRRLSSLTWSQAQRISPSSAMYRLFLRDAQAVIFSVLSAANSVAGIPLASLKREFTTLHETALLLLLSDEKLSELQEIADDESLCELETRVCSILAANGIAHVSQVECLGILTRRFSP